MGKYIYDSHLGGLYTWEERQSDEDLYCETCGDSDWELGYCCSREEARRCIESASGIFLDDEYIEEFLNEEFPEEGDG